MSFSNFLKFLEKNFGLIVLLLLVSGVSFFVGGLWKENRILGASMNGAKQVAQVGNNNAPTGANNAAPPAGNMDELPPVTDSDHIRGAANPKVTIVEYSDYECPFCQRFHPTMQQVMTEYGDQVAWVYRHYPLSIHPQAQKAAEGGECATELGGEDAFWAYTDAMFAENEKLGGTLTADSINVGAAAAGVNLDQFKECVSSGRYTQKVKDEMSAGAKAGVSGTPGSFVVTQDGVQEMIPGALPYEQVKATIEQYL